MKSRFQSSFQTAGFSSLELLLVLALSAIVIGGAVVSYGTLTRHQPSVASFISVPLGTDRMTHFYAQSATTRNTPSAPHYGTVALAEELREQFYHDVISATAVFCLPRVAHNQWRPAFIPYNPVIHGELDTPEKFRAHIIAAAGVPASLYLPYRNPENTASTAPAANASIFILAFSKYENQMKVLAIYDIDVIRFSSGTPQGFYASVKRYTDRPGTIVTTASFASAVLDFAGGYDVFYPPSVPNPTNASSWSSDGFTPLFITFERFTRRAIRESDMINRFKVAAERPFYFVWWPDPAARHLGPVPNTLSPTDPRQAYNHMAGRSSFMFTVPMFPAL